MADVCEECVVMNGFWPKVTVLNKDARQLTVKDILDENGSIRNPRDIERRADILVFETFDSGLIGE